MKMQRSRDTFRSTTDPWSRYSYRKGRSNWYSH